MKDEIAVPTSIEQCFRFTVHPHYPVNSRALDFVFNNFGGYGRFFELIRSNHEASSNTIVITELSPRGEGCPLQAKVACLRTMGL